MTMKALTTAAPGTHVLGVPGLTTGAVGIMTMILGAIVIWYVRGMADRRRAENEGVTTLSTAHDLLFKNMQAEISRLTLLVAEQGREIAQLKRELHETRRQELGSIRNAAQTDLSTIAALKDDK